MKLISLVFVQEFSVPPEVVWPWISDAAHLSEWSAVTVTPISPGPNGGMDEAGAIRTVRLPMGPMTLTLQEQILESNPPQQFVYSVFRGGMVRSHRGTINLNPTETGTLLEWEVQMRPSIPGTGWIAKRSLTAQFEEGLQALSLLVSEQASSQR